MTVGADVEFYVGPGIVVMTGSPYGLSCFAEQVFFPVNVVGPHEFLPLDGIAVLLPLHNLDEVVQVTVLREAKKGTDFFEIVKYHVACFLVVVLPYSFNPATGGEE